VSRPPNAHIGDQYPAASCQELANINRVARLSGFVLYR